MYTNVQNFVVGKIYIFKDFYFKSMLFIKTFYSLKNPDNIIMIVKLANNNEEACINYS